MELILIIIGVLNLGAYITLIAVVYDIHRKQHLISLRDARVLKHQDYKLYLKLFGEKDIQETFFGNIRTIRKEETEE